MSLSRKFQGIQLTEDDLKQVAIAAAESINGFSFENLWLKGLACIIHEHLIKSRESLTPKRAKPFHPNNSV